MNLESKQYYPLADFIKEYSEKNTNSLYRPVAVGRYGIRSRESIYSKELAKDYSKNKLIYKDTLTVGMGSVQIDIGVLTDDVVYSVSPAYHTFKVTNIDSKYLDYCLQCRNLDMFERYVKKSARQGKTIDFKSWLTYKIPVYDEETQREIVLRIETIKQIISKLENEQKLYDELIKARFVELFGNENNSKGWKEVEVSDVADVSVGIVIKPAQYYTSKEEGIKTFRSLNIGEMCIKDSDWVYISETGNEKNKKSQLKENDLLVVRSGAPGTSCVITKEYEGCNAIDVIIVHPDTNIVDPYYLCAYTNYPHGKDQIKGGTGGAAQQHFNVGKYNALKLFLPPMEEQKRFTDFLKQLDKSKDVCQRKIKLYQELLDKKMDEYFNPKENEA